MEISEKIKVMQHFENGGKVEFSEKKDGNNHWTTVTSPSWDWAYFEYRIEEQKQKVAIEKWLCRDNEGVYAVIESSNVDKFKRYAKFKLIESYEVEL